MAQLALLAFSLLAVPSADGWCAEGRITGYVRSEYGPLTADGTPILTDEPIAAAGYAIPLGSYVDVDGVGSFRVADRGMLGPTDVDIAVWSRADAYALTSTRRVCIRGAEE
jgi:3D (Asp-Asp-Asp) domain-containing protein